MLLPRELIYIEKSNFDVLIEDSFIKHVFDILIDLEDKENMCLVESNVDIENTYVAFFNMVFYLATEARHKSNPSFRIKEYVSYIEDTSMQLGLNEDLCREIALSLLYYLYENLPKHDTRFLERLKKYIVSEYLFEKIGKCQTELESHGWSYFANYGALPRYTLEYLKKCAWKKITHNYDMNSIRYILEYTTSYKCERKNIADSIIFAIEEEYIELMNGSEFIDCCRKLITDFLEEIGGWDGELDYKGIVRHHLNFTKPKASHEQIDENITSLKSKVGEQEKIIRDKDEYISRLESERIVAENYMDDEGCDSNRLDTAQLIILFETLLNVTLDASQTNLSALSRFLAKVSGYKEGSVRSKINEKAKGGSYDNAKAKRDAAMLVELLKSIDKENVLRVVSRLKENFGL